MAKQNKFGTFGGVFVPSILTILGVIMYLRLPWIVGEAGLWATLGIIMVAHIISVTTGMSVSSIATDKKVEAGGTYYMISRSLGLPIGGTLGIALFIGLSFSVSLYLIGFSESFLGYWGLSTDINNIRITGTIILLAVTTLTFISTSLAVKTQYFIMAAIGISLISVFFGKHPFVPAAPWFENPAPTMTLMVLFGIFFPAVTGFEAGVSMSGDLKDPKKSIPLGSIMAIVVGLVVYIGLAFFFAYTVDGQMLASDPNILLKIAWIPELVIAGIWGATLSSALGSILGAPRILQATATDKITPRFFAKGYGATNEPRNALLATFIIAEMGILIGELNMIARVVSVFFITTYGFLNISAAFERWTSTDFRPEFKVPGWVSLIGAITCLLVMIQLDLGAMLGATALMGLLFLVLKHRALSIESGDAWSSVWASLVKTGITKLKKEKLHKRNWRPNIIMFSGNPETRQHIFEIGEAISGSMGILSGFELIEDPHQRESRFQSVLRETKSVNSHFLNKITTPDIFTGMDEIARVHGFAGLEPNTILLGWSNDPKRKNKFIKLLEDFEHYGFSTVVLDYDDERGYGNHETIDIWWNGEDRNLAFALRLINHLTRSSLWKSSKKRLIIINPRSEDTDRIYRATLAVLRNFRETAEIKIINNDSDTRPVGEIITDTSRDTDLVIMGIAPRQFRENYNAFEGINRILPKIGNVLLINASSDFEEISVIPPVLQAVKESDEKADTVAILPLLIPTTHPEIDTLINQMDSGIQREIDTFGSRALKPSIITWQSALNAVEEQMPKIRQFFVDVAKTRSRNAAEELLESIHTDVLANIRNTRIQLLGDKAHDALYEDLQIGLEHLKNALQQTVLDIPHKLRVLHPRDAFTVTEIDGFSAAWYKRMKRFMHSFSKSPIPISVGLREEARQFVYYRNMSQIQQFLQHFKENERQLFEFLGQIINHINTVLDELEHHIAHRSPKPEMPADIEEIEGLIRKQKGLLNDWSEQNIYMLKAAARTGIQEMSDLLASSPGQRRAVQHDVSGKKLRQLVSEVSGFTADHLAESKTLINMIALQLSINSAKNNSRYIIIEFEERLSEILQKKVMLPINHVVKAMKREATKQEVDSILPNLGFEAELVDVYNLSKEKLASLIQTMPESVEIYGAEKDDSTRTIPVARMMGYYMKSRYEVTIEERFAVLLDGIKQSVSRLKEHITLAFFSFENAEKKKAEIIDDAIKKIDGEKENIKSQLQVFITLSRTQFENVYDPMSAGKLEESAEHFESGLRRYRSKKVLGSVSRLTQKARKLAIGGITKALYTRSEGILLARRLRTSKELTSTTSRLLDLLEKVSPSSNIIEALPPFYITLFSGKSSIGMDFWINRPVEEEAFKRAIDRYRQGFRGGILVLAERNSGKTAFCRRMASLHLEAEKVFMVFPPIQGTITTDGFTQALMRATGRTGDLHMIMNQLPQGSTLIINDTELFWERTDEGQRVITLLEELIDSFGEKILFVVNINPHAYKLINRLSAFGNHFIENIVLQPFDSEDIRELILKRHRSSGMQIEVGAENQPLNELNTARLFNGLFNYSGGQVGTALNGWLRSIKESNSEVLSVEIPDYPETTILKEMGADWEMLLSQFIIHKRLTPEKMQRLSGWSPAVVHRSINAMMRAGIIAEKTSGIYHIQPHIHPFLVDSLKETGLLS